MLLDHRDGFLHRWFPLAFTPKYAFLRRHAVIDVE